MVTWHLTLKAMQPPIKAELENIRELYMYGLIQLAWYIKY